MQAHQSSFGKENADEDCVGPERHRRHHQRQQSLGKAMPVTSLLLNFPPLHRSAYYTRHERSPEYEFPPFYFNINDNQQHEQQQQQRQQMQQQQQQSKPKNSPISDADESDDETEFELLVSDCSGSNNDDGNGDDDDDDNEHGVSIIGNSKFYTPCLTCTQNAPADLAAQPSAINEMCRRLCTDECRLRLSLAGFEPPAIEKNLKAQETLAAHVYENLGKHAKNKVGEQATPPIMPPTRPPPVIAIQRKKFLMDLLTPISDTDSETNFANDDKNELMQVVSAVVDDNKANDGYNVEDHDEEAEEDFGAARVIVEPHELALLKDFRERFEIAEALAKTSAMTSTSQIKQRLAARKLEIELETQSKSLDAMAAATTANDVAAAKHDCWRNDSKNNDDDESDSDNEHENENDNGCGKDEGHRRHHQLLSDAGGADAVVALHAVGNKNYAPTAMTRSDTAATAPKVHRQAGNDFEPPRDLLLYLVRMGSFNSAPKINNIDSQDDDLDLPKNLNTNELLQHVKNLRGQNFPPLLSRYFLKPIPTLTAQLAGTDITDSFYYLQLNSVSRVCSAPISSAPNHFRLLQWNILSQTLGQNNDGFVRCPEEALTWDNRKFLIVQEILQNNPDIICLQEVDHFKFLQNILGTQNYEGIFFPKPDSPCLYIEENNGPDGCAIFFKRDKFEVKSFETRVLEVWRVQSNQVAIAANLYVKSLGREICVCTTHLKARHGALLSKLRNEQGRDLLRFVRNFAGDDRPVILCGDFNAEPIEPVYATILSCEKMNFSSAYADIRRNAMIEEIIDEKATAIGVAAAAMAPDTYANTLDSSMTHDVAIATTATANADDCQQQDHHEEENYVQKSIENEPPYTTWKIREDGEECHTIDYVFYAKNKFRVLNCLEFPHGEEIGKNRTPSFQYPSDHFSLVCDFEILHEQPTIKDCDGADHGHGNGKEGVPTAPFHSKLNKKAQ